MRGSVRGAPSDRCSYRVCAMNKTVFEIFAFVLFVAGVGLAIMSILFGFEIFPYSGLVGFGFCIMAAYLITVVVAKEKPKASKEDLSKTNFPGGGA